MAKKEVVNISAILARTVNLESLIRSNPELFNLSALKVEDKLELLKADSKFYMPLIDVTTFNPTDKVYVLLNAKNKGISGLITFTEDELVKIDDRPYGELVRKDFRFMRASRFPKMLKSDQQEIFLQEPAWVIANTDKPPRLTSERLTALARRKPSFIETYIEDFSGYSTTDDFWKSMIAYNDKFKEVFMKNTKTLITKTQVRAVVWKYPSLIMMIDENTLLDSKLTGKEWVILINSVMESNEAEFKDWQFPASVAEMMKIDLMAELLNGKASMSVRFQNAMKGVFKTPEEEQENENTSIS